MALVIKDRVKESSTTTGTGAYTLNGAEAGFQSFAAIGDGNTTYYAATDGTDWEVGIGTYASSGTSLARTTILSSSNSGVAVNWGAGEKLIFVTQPAGKAVYTDASGKVPSGASFGGYVDMTAVTAPAHAEGRVFYDSTNKSLTVYNDEADISLQVGQEQWLRVYNDTGSDISNGSPVYLTGVTSGTPTIALANASSSTAYDCIGLATHTIEAASYGYVTTYGIVRGIDTSGLTAGAHFFVGNTSGELTSSAPVYPNYPITMGWVLSSSGSGDVVVSREPNTINGLRVIGDGYVGSNLTVGGDLTVQGTQTVASSQNVSLGAPFNYLNAGDTVGEANTVFTGTGIDDGYFTGHYNGTTTKTFYVQIDGEKTGTGGVDTFRWSYNSDMTSPQATGVDMAIGNNTLADGISIYFPANKHHTLNDKWAGGVAPVNVDTGFFTNYNTGTTGTGYTHTGFFYDASSGKWTLLSEYDPEPEGEINVAHASTVFGTLKAGTFEGALSGNATTASKLATARSISLTGDVSGSTSFDGSGNVSITATVANDSHTHSDYVEKTGGTMTGTLGVPTVDFGDWTITESGGALYFAYQGTNKFKLDNTGTLSVTNDVQTDQTL